MSFDEDEDGDADAVLIERVTVRFTEPELDRLDRLVDSGRYPSRSEAIRAAVRQLCDENPNQTALARLRRQREAGD